MRNTERHTTGVWQRPTRLLVGERLTSRINRAGYCDQLPHFPLITDPYHRTEIIMTLKEFYHFADTHTKKLKYDEQDRLPCDHRDYLEQIDAEFRSCSTILIPSPKCANVKRASIVAL